MPVIPDLYLGRTFISVFELMFDFQGVKSPRIPVLFHQKMKFDEVNVLEDGRSDGSSARRGDKIGCFFRLREHTVSGPTPCAHYSGLDKL
jgi:hypothetical protein